MASADHILNTVQLDDPLIFLQKASGLFILQSSVFWKRCSLFLIGYLQILILPSYPKILYGNLNYLSYTGLMQTSIIVSLCMIAIAPDLIRFSTYVKKEAYCLKSAGEDVYGRIIKECKLIKILCVSSMCLLSWISIISGPALGDEHLWQYPFHFIKEHIQYLQWVFLIPMYIAVHITILSIGFLLNVGMYNIAHILFQWHILNHFVIRMSRGMVFNLNDVRYQERVEKQLKRCVRMQSNILRLTKVINIYADHLIFLLIITAAIIFVSATFFIVTGVSPKSNIRMSFILIPWFEQLCTFCFYCQQIINESHNVFTNALQCPWYNWNIRNRKTYLLFLTGNTKVTKLSMYQWVYVESSLILRVCRLSYSILALLLKIRKRR